MDLNQMFGDKYLVTSDESWEAESPENRAEFLDAGEESCYYEVRGKLGVVYSFSKIQVAVVVSPRVGRRLVKLMGSELMLLQHADDAMCYKADIKLAETLIRFIKPKRLRPLTPEHKAALAAQLARYRFKTTKFTQTNRSSQTEPASVSLGVAS